MAGERCPRVELDPCLSRDMRWEIVREAARAAALLDGTRSSVQDRRNGRTGPAVVPGPGDAEDREGEGNGHPRAVRRVKQKPFGPECGSEQERWQDDQEIHRHRRWNEQHQSRACEGDEHKTPAARTAAAADQTED